MGRGALGAAQVGAVAGYYGATRGALVGANTVLAAGHAAIGLGYGGYRVAAGALGMMTGGRPFATKSMSVMGRNVNVPTAFSRRFQNSIVGVALGGAVVMGAVDEHRNRRWNLTQALATGSVEVEQPHFLGATGSLVLASHRRRRGMMPTGQGDPGSDYAQYMATQVGAHADDMMRMMVR